MLTQGHPSVLPIFLPLPSKRKASYLFPPFPPLRGSNIPPSTTNHYPPRHFPFPISLNRFTFPPPFLFLLLYISLHALSCSQIHRHCCLSLTMEVPVISRIQDVHMGLTSLQNPSFSSGVQSVSFAYTFCKWSAVILALVTTFGGLIHKVNVLIVTFRRHIPPLPSISIPLLNGDDYSSSDEEEEEEEVSSSRSSLSSEFEEEWRRMKRRRLLCL